MCDINTHNEAKYPHHPPFIYKKNKVSRNLNTPYIFRINRYHDILIFRYKYVMISL